MYIILLLKILDAKWIHVPYNKEKNKDKNKNEA